MKTKITTLIVLSSLAIITTSSKKQGVEVSGGYCCRSNAGGVCVIGDIVVPDAYAAETGECGENPVILCVEQN